MLQEPVGIEPTTSWSPVKYASNWPTEAGLITVLRMNIILVNSKPSTHLGPDLHYLHQLRKIEMCKYMFSKIIPSKTTS